MSVGCNGQQFPLAVRVINSVGREAVITDQIAHCFPKLLLQAGLMVGAATLLYGFLSIRLDDTTIIDYLRYAFKFFIRTQQYFEWR